MVLRCWRQDPAHRPSVTEVVGLLREWSVSSLLIEPTLSHASCSYRLRAVDMPFSHSPLRPPIENANAATSRASISQVPTDGKSTPTNSSRPNPQSHKTPANPILTPSAPHPAVPHGPCDPLHEPSPDEPHILSNTGNSHVDPISIAHCLCIVHADNHCHREKSLRLGNLPQCQLADNVDTATNLAPALALVDGEPNSTGLLATPLHSGQPNFKTHEVLMDPSPVFNPPRKPVSNELGVPSKAGNSNGGHPLSSIHSVRTVSANDHRTVPTPGAHPTELGYEGVQRHIDEIAEVM